MKKRTLLSCFLIAYSFITMGQKSISLTIKYDSSFDRYEVLAKPNFTTKNFTWGPSQISVVVPSGVLLRSLDIKNVDGGQWDDTSIIIAPEASPNNSFFGISSGGEKTDMVENIESVLFYFSLPKSVDANKVRIFNNEADPKSVDKGMMGGDFRNTIIDYTGRELFDKAYVIASTQPKEEREIANNTLLEVKTYPNVVTENKFRVSIKGVDESENLLMIFYNESGTEISRKDVSYSESAKQSFELPKNIGQQAIVKFITSKGTTSTRIVIE